MLVKFIDDRVLPSVFKDTLKLGEVYEVVEEKKECYLVKKPGSFFPISGEYRKDRFHPINLHATKLREMLAIIEQSSNRFSRAFEERHLVAGTKTYASLMKIGEEFVSVMDDLKKEIAREER